MANEQRNREEKGGPDRFDQDQHRQTDEDGQHRDDEKNRREQNERERGTGQQARES